MDQDPQEIQEGNIGDRPNGSLHLWEIKWARDLFWVLVAIVTIWFVVALRAIFMPVLASLLLAYVANPLIVWSQNKWNWSRLIPVSLLIVAFVVLLSLAAVLAIGQIIEFATSLPGYVKDLAERSGFEANDLIKALDGLEPGEILPKIAPYLWRGTTGTVDVVTSLFQTTAYVGTLLVLMPFYFFFFAWRFPEIVAWPSPLIPASHRQRTREVLQKMDLIVSNFFRVRLIIAVLMGMMFSFGWMLAGVPYWFLLGMLGGLLSIIPYAAVLAWLTAILLKYLELSSGFDVMSVLVWPTVVYGIVQVIEGWGLTPFLQGKEMDMGTVEIIIVLFVGGALAGLLGMLLCIPAWACIKVLLREVAGPQIRHWAELH